MTELAQLAPQIAVAVAIVGCAIILLRELRRDKRSTDAISRRDLLELRAAIEHRKPTGSTLDLAAKVDAHTTQLDGLTSIVAECRTDIAELKQGQIEILEFVTHTNGKSLPPTKAA